MTFWDLCDKHPVWLWATCIAAFALLGFALLIYENISIGKQNTRRMLAKFLGKEQKP